MDICALILYHVIMEHKRFGETYYIRVDKGDEIVQSILKVCRDEGISSAVFSGIGGCSSAELQTFIPERGDFDTERTEGMLELISIMGNLVTDEDGELFHHTHAVFSYKDEMGHHVIAGHLKSSTVLYTAEIELRPVIGGTIGRKFDPETGTGFWSFDESDIGVS